MRRLAIVLALVTLATAAAAARPASTSSGAAAADASPSITHPATGAPLFFTLQAAGALLTVDIDTGSGNLTLAGVSPTATWWTERPTRAAGALTTASLASDARLLGADGTWLATPNAVLAGIAPLDDSAVMASVVLTLGAPIYEPRSRLFTLPVDVVGIAPLDPWGEPVGEGGEGGEGGGSGGGTGGGGGPGVSAADAAPLPRTWRDLATAQAAARAAARAHEEPGPSSIVQLALQGASLIIDQWLLPTSYSQGSDGWCVSAMDPNCQPWAYYGGGGSYWMYAP